MIHGATSQSAHQEVLFKGSVEDYFKIVKDHPLRPNQTRNNKPQTRNPPTNNTTPPQQTKTKQNQTET